MLFGMTHKLKRTIRNHLVHELPHDATDQQLIEAESHLTPTQLMDMVPLDARAYTIKYVATRKRNERAEKQEIQDWLDDAIRVLELDNGQDIEHTNKLFYKVNTLKHTTQARNDYEEEEKARKFMAKRNLEAETPTKNFFNQINKSRKKVQLSCLLQERELTPKKL